MNEKRSYNFAPALDFIINYVHLTAHYSTH